MIIVIGNHGYFSVSLPLFILCKTGNNSKGSRIIGLGLVNIIQYKIDTEKIIQ